MSTDDFPADVSSTAYLRAGGTATGTIETAGDVDWFRVAVDADHAWRFTASYADGATPIIALYSVATGAVVYTNDPNAEAGLKFGDPFALVQSGDYYLQVKGGSSTGAYTLGLQAAADDYGNSAASALALGTTAAVAARFDYAYDAEQFRIAAVKDVSYTVTLAADGPIDAYGQLWLGSDIKTSDAEYGNGTVSITFTATETRDYLVSAHIRSTLALSGGTVPYHVSVASSDTTAPKVVSVSGSVDGPITIVFNEDIHLGSGKVTLLNGLLSPLESFDLSNAIVQGNTLTFDPGHVLAVRGYSLQFTDGSISDAAGNGVSSAQMAAPFTLNTLQNGDTVQSGYGLYGTSVSGTAAHTHDTVVYDGAQSDYTFTKTDSGYTVSRADGANIALSSIERVLFTGSGDELALSLDGNLGQVYRLYQAAFDRTPDKIGFGFWVSVSDKGVTLHEIAQNFISSAEFASLYGANSSNAAFVSALYDNVLHRAGDAGGVEYWNMVLNNGASRADVLTEFSESTENLAQVATLVGNGFTYTPFG